MNKYQLTFPHNPELNTEVTVKNDDDCQEIHDVMRKAEDIILKAEGKPDGAFGVFFWAEGKGGTYFCQRPPFNMKIRKYPPSRNNKEAWRNIRCVIKNVDVDSSLSSYADKLYAVNKKIKEQVIIGTKSTIRMILKMVRESQKERKEGGHE